MSPGVSLADGSGLTLERVSTGRRLAVLKVEEVGVQGLGPGLVGGVVVRFEVGVLESLLDGDAFAWREREAAAHEVKRVGLGLGAHLAQVAAAVEREGALGLAHSLHHFGSYRRGQKRLLTTYEVVSVLSACYILREAE